MIVGDARGQKTVDGSGKICDPSVEASKCPDDGDQHGPFSGEDNYAIRIVSDDQLAGTKMQLQNGQSTKDIPCIMQRKWKLYLVGCNIFMISMSLIALVVLLYRVFPRSVLPVAQEIDRVEQCTPLQIPLCQKHKVPYTYSQFPNQFGQKSQADARTSIANFEPLVSVKCYALLPLFLCSVFAPKCLSGGVIVPPCRSLCIDAQHKCSFFLGVFGLSWPTEVDCDQLPESSDPDVCVGNQERQDVLKLVQTCEGGFRCDRTRCLPQSWLCDGYPDCDDHDDEKNCSHCGHHQFFCGREDCIERSAVCDGIQDCRDGRDERQCLRLNGRTSGESNEGWLEAYEGESDTWRQVCGENWTNLISKRACRMLGYRDVNETRIRDETPAESPEVRVVGTTVGHAAEYRKHMKTLFTKNRHGCHNTNVAVYLKCQNFECGRTALVSRSMATWRIVGGQQALPGNWPWLVALHGGPDEIFFCGGVLLSRWWVLSAAHCVGNQTDPSGWTVKVGMTRRMSSSAFFTQKRRIAAIYKHPEYNTVSVHSNDIALVLLSEPVNFDDFLRPICLPSPHLQLTPGTSCTVIGWGKTMHDDDADYEPVIHEVEVPVIDHATCSEWYSSQDVTISDSMVCAGYAEGKKDACQGDSGGPLLCQDRSLGHWVVAGVVSWGINCAQPNLPGIYTNVPMFMRWIDSVMTTAPIPEVRNHGSKRTRTASTVG